MSLPPLLPRPRRLERTGAGAPVAAAPETRRDASLPAQGYALDTAGPRPVLRHADAAGLRYGRETLRQLARGAADGRLPGVRIEDAPDFPVRGLMLDVSRDRVPTRESLALLVGRMARLRLNHLELYVEHTFAHPGHEAVWREASPLTADDLRGLDALCAEHGIELAANQNTFGHMERWLRHPAYRARAEAPGGWTTRAGGRRPPAVLAPTEENARLALELCRNQLACLASRRVNIGCDETFELGKGVSAAAVEARGRGDVYLEHLLRILEPLRAEGCEVLFWGDVLRSHPDCVRRLPREGVVALAWHYEAPLDPARLPDAARRVAADLGFDLETLRGFETQVAPFAEAGVPFWVCPGTSAWNSFVGRLGNARANLRDAAQHGLAAGARGLLVTDWGDHGHHQPPAVSLAPLADAAAVAWCLEANRELDLAAAVDALVVEDEAGVLGGVLARTGEAWARTGAFAVNASPLFAALVPPGPLGVLGAPDAEALETLGAALEADRRALAAARPRAADGALLLRELDAAIRLARHGAWRLARDHGLAAPDDAALGRDLAEAIALQREAWLARSRPGGLTDSLARLERAAAAYGEPDPPPPPAR